MVGINLELIFADLEVINSRIGRIEKKAISTKDKDALFELVLMKKIKETPPLSKFINNSSTISPLFSVKKLQKAFYQ